MKVTKIKFELIMSLLDCKFENKQKNSKKKRNSKFCPTGNCYLVR